MTLTTIKVSTEPFKRKCLMLRQIQESTLCHMFHVRVASGIQTISLLINSNDIMQLYAFCQTKRHFKCLYGWAFDMSVRNDYVQNV